MDFEKILRVARKNELTKKEPVKCLQTRFRPPTKEQHEKDKTLSEGVQKFLARKEMEEKKKQMEAERRRQELMALRAKDPKANKRIQTMLKRTKSANKSVMEDAVDNNNTADTLAGPSQPDEDDYGFVSETSSQLYNKLIQKMYSTPSDDLPKFAPSKKPSGVNLLNTKERVKMALLRQEEEDKLPHKRKRKGKEKKDGDEEEDVNLEYGIPDRDLSKVSSESVKEKNEKPKVRKPLPPPVDFHELLKIAEQKQHEPINFDPKPKKPQEPEVLMTKKQKLEYEKMQEWKRQKELRLQNIENGVKSNGHEDKKPIPKIPKLNHSSADAKPGNSASQKKSTGTEDRTNGSKGSTKSSVKAKEPSEKERSFKGSQSKVSGEKKSVDDETSRLIRERDEAIRKLKEREQLIRERDEAVRKLKLLEESEKVKNCSKPSEVTATKTQRLTSGKGISKSADSVRPSKSDLGTMASKSIPKKAETGADVRSAPNGAGPRGFPPKDLRPAAKAAVREGSSQNLQRSKRFPPADVRRRPLPPKRRRIESDEEYDSELDDFIDDGDNEMSSEEVSKAIFEVFKYDKNKYSNYDDDDECMESNFARISKEEFFSTKCGILEDLKDIQREKAKLAKKKKI